LPATGGLSTLEDKGTDTDSSLYLPVCATVAGCLNKWKRGEMNNNGLRVSSPLLSFTVSFGLSMEFYIQY